MLLKPFAFILLLVVALVKSDDDVQQKQLSKARQCTVERLMCDDCETLVRCIKNDDGDWEKELAEECEGGRTCSRFTSPHSCTFAQNNDCDANVVDYEHDCTRVGLYPHPFNCKKYYNCINDEDGEVIPKPISMECKNGYGYDPLTTNCRIALKDQECPEKLLIEPCTSVGRLDAIKGSPHLYSICLAIEENERKIYFPHIYYCNDHEEFITDRCVRPESGLDEEGRCYKLGFFYDPEDCKKYHECLLTGIKPTTRSCLIGYEFDKFSRVCESFDC